MHFVQVVDFKERSWRKGCSDLHLMYFLAQMNIGVILVLGVKSEADLDFMQQEELGVTSEGSVEESRSS